MTAAYIPRAVSLAQREVWFRLCLNQGETGDLSPSLRAPTTDVDRHPRIWRGAALRRCRLFRPRVRQVRRRPREPSLRARVPTPHDALQSAAWGVTTHKRTEVLRLALARRCKRPPRHILRDQTHSQLVEYAQAQHRIGVCRRLYSCERSERKTRKVFLAQLRCQKGE